MENLVLEMQESMQKSLENLWSNFNTLRTGRASAAILERIECDYYGEKMPIIQISSISIPEPRQIVVKPYDKGDMRSVLAALNASNLGINPINDGDQIRLIFPPLTQERRQDLTKQAKKYTEEAKIAVRNIRREFLDLLKAAEGYGEDAKKRVEDEINKATSEMVDSLDQAYKKKETEILTI
ncbi:MAG: ribosome recycling factor [Bacilli bacterium]|jgi:ribosome recycling factor